MEPRWLDGLTTRSAKQQEDLQADKDSTIHALLILPAGVEDLLVIVGVVLTKAKTWSRG